MATINKEELLSMAPQKFRSLVREGTYTGETIEVCQGYTQANLTIVPLEYAFEFLLFCNRNPLPSPVIDVTEPGNPEPRFAAPGADVRTDVSRYRVYQNGEIIDEPYDIKKYWRGNLVAFITGCSRTFVWPLRAANISWRRYGAYPTNIDCVPAGRFFGHMAVTVRAFKNSHDAVRAVQITSRHPAGHGAPVHIGDPQEIGIDLGALDPFIPTRPVTEPPKPGEIIMSWGCGVTMQLIAVERKLPFVITHFPTHTFITDRPAEELAVL